VLVPVGDVCALRAALERLLDDRELRDRLGRAARARAQELLTWDQSTARTLRCYEELFG
jgi:glycosyltransferase involved in cell wall biosynthesis